MHLTRVDEIKQELTSLRFKYGVVALLGILTMFFTWLPIPWVLNIPLGKRIKELNDELMKLEGRVKPTPKGYGNCVIVGVIIGIIVLAVVVEILK